MIRAVALVLALAFVLAGCDKDSGRLQGWAEADFVFVGPDEAGWSASFEKCEPLDVAPMMIRAHVDILFGGRGP